MQPEYLASAFDMQKLSDRLPKREKIFMKQNAYYMHNRAKYHLELKKLFKKHEEARRNGDKYSDNSELLVHQRVVFDYLNLYTPYRGILIYHGLGSGKTFTSVAIAERELADWWAPTSSLTPRMKSALCKWNSPADADFMGR